MGRNHSFKNQFSSIEIKQCIYELLLKIETAWVSSSTLVKIIYRNGTIDF